MIEVFIHPVTNTPRPADYIVDDPRAAPDLADEFQDVDMLLMPVRDLEACAREVARRFDSAP